MRTLTKLVMAAFCVLALSGIPQGDTIGLSPTSLGYINKANAEMDKVPVNENWLKNGYTAAERDAVHSHIQTLKMVLRKVQKLHRRINSQDNKTPEAKAVWQRLKDLAKYQNTLVGIYNKGPRKATEAEQAAAAKSGGAAAAGTPTSSAARIAKAEKLLAPKLRRDWLPGEDDNPRFDGLEAHDLPFGYKERPQVVAHLDALKAALTEARELLQGHSRAESFSAPYRQTEKRSKEVRDFINDLGNALNILPPRTPALWKKAIEAEIETLVKDRSSCYYTHADVGIEEQKEAANPRVRVRVRGGRSAIKRPKKANRNAAQRARLERIVRQANQYEGPGKEALQKQIQKDIIRPFESVKTGLGGKSWKELRELAASLNDARHKWPEAPKSKADVPGVKRYVQGLVDKMLLSRDMMKLRQHLRGHDCGKSLVPLTLKALEQWRWVYLRQDYQSNRRKAGVNPHPYWHQDLRSIYKSAKKPWEAGDVGNLNSEMSAIATVQKKLIDHKEIFTTYPLWAKLEAKNLGEPKQPLPPFDPVKPLRDNYDDSVNWTEAQILAATPAHMEEWKKVFKTLFDELAEKLVQPEEVKDRKAKKLARKLGSKHAFPVSGIERKEQEMTETIEVTRDKVKFIKWTNIYDVFEFMWIQPVKGAQPWPHMKSDKTFCEIYRAIGIKYKKGRKVKKGKWLRKEDDHLGYVLCPVK